MVSNIFYFHPYLGKWSNLTNIFQMGWNHQLVKFSHLFLVPTPNQTSAHSYSGPRWNYRCKELMDFIDSLVQVIFEVRWIFFYTRERCRGLCSSLLWWWWSLCCFFLFFFCFFFSVCWTRWRASGEVSCHMTNMVISKNTARCYYFDVFQGKQKGFFQRDVCHTWFLNDME